jgi:hypothetical protein
MGGEPVNDLYRIAPLDWRCIRPAGDPDGDWWTVETVFGSMSVECDNGRFLWRYCFDEYYDEDSHTCESLEAGKAEAEAYYRERLLPALLPEVSQ